MIDVQNLTFTYAKAETPAIHRLNFTIAAGEIFGFLGPSGAGKSTTQKILIGLLKGYQGVICVLGKNLSDWNADYYEHIGVAFEFPNHFLKLTAIENLRYFGSLYNHPTLKPEATLEMVGLQEDASVPVGQYSKGMKGRLSIARALLHNPDLLFLDEPTSGLDPVNARNIKDLIKAQQDAGKTIFLTTHNMSDAGELCDRVAFIMDGAIRLIGSPHELRLEYGKPLVRVEYGVNSQAETRDFPLPGIGENPAFLDLLRSGTVRTIHSQEATLEDVFIRVTGRRLE